MANDIAKAIGSNDIKNGTVVVGCLPTGDSDNLKNDDSVSNEPTITDIQAKYDARLDHPRYYTGDTIG